MNITKIFTRKAKVEQPLIVLPPTPHTLRTEYLVCTFNYALELSRLSMLAEINGFNSSFDYYKRQHDFIIANEQWTYYANADERSLKENNH